MFDEIPTPASPSADGTSSDRPAPPQRIRHVQLHVRNLQQSATFYDEVFGLKTRPDKNGSPRRCWCVPAARRSGMALELVADRLGAGGAMGASCFCVEMNSPNDVSALRSRAKAHGARTTTPRTEDDRFHATIFDPDGHKIMVTAFLGDADASERRDPTD